MVHPDTLAERDMTLGEQIIDIFADTHKRLDGINQGRAECATYAAAASSEPEAAYWVSMSSLLKASADFYVSAQQRLVSSLLGHRNIKITRLPGADKVFGDIQLGGGVEYDDHQPDWSPAIFGRAFVGEGYIFATCGSYNQRVNVVNEDGKPNISLEVGESSVVHI